MRLVLFIVAAAVLHAGQDDFLRRHAGFCEKDLSAISRGEPVAHTLPSAAASELAVAGAIRLNISIREFLARFRQITTFKQSPEVVAIGMFEDLPESQRKALAAQAAQYQKSPESIELAHTAEFLAEYAPPPAERFTYWSKERLLRKPVLTVTEVTIANDESSRQAFILTRQIYASDYFDASLGITALFEGDDGLWLIYINRSRSRCFTGPMGGIKRSVASSVITSTLRRKLVETRSRLVALTAQR